MFTKIGQLAWGLNSDRYDRSPACHWTTDLSSSCYLQFSGVYWVGQVPARCLQSRFEGWPQWAHPSRPFIGPFFLGRNHSQIYPHMPAKFGHDQCRIESAWLEIRGSYSSIEVGGCPFNGRLCVFEISPRNTGTIFADCPAIRLAGLTPPCSFPCLAGGGLAFPLIARQPLTRHC